MYKGIQGESTIYSPEFLNDLCLIASRIKYSSDYINEIFLYFYISLFEKKCTLVLESSQGLLPSLHGKSDLHLWQIAALQTGVKLSFVSRLGLYFKSFILFFWSLLIVVGSSIAIPMYAMIHFNKSTRGAHSKVIIVRAPSYYQKVSFLQNEGVVCYIDNFAFSHNGVSSLYGAVGWAKRFKSIFYVPVYSLIDFFKIYRDTKGTVGLGLTGYVLNYYAKRIAHKCNFEFYLDAILVEGKVKTYYTANKEDRFALLEKRLCKKHKVHCICIPHGLEYSFKMPGGLVGDEFYCTSANAKVYLEKLYSDEKISFHFNEGIAKKMFSREFKKTKKRSLVFFPESREPKVNLQIMEFVVSEGLELNVKLHEKDNIENYRSLKANINFIDSFDEAISSNICLARKSTVLVEALYNKSIAISVLIDHKDKSYVDLMFPSLVDKNVLRVETFPQLLKMLIELKVEAVTI